MNIKRINNVFFVATCLAVNLTGCSNAQHQVIAATGTVIGLEISENLATQTANAKLGYNRSELAIVPTNRSQCAKDKNTEQVQCPAQQGGGAKDTTDVLMELHYKSNLTLTGDAAVYQRLAVGENAVKQTGATLMFSKDDAGNIDPTTAKYLSQAKVEIEVEQDHLRKIVTYVTNSKGDIIDENLKALVDTAKKNAPNLFTEEVVAEIQKAKTGELLNNLLYDKFDEEITPLYKAIPSGTEVKTESSGL